MIVRHLAWYLLAAIIAVAPLVNPFMSFEGALRIGIVPLAVLGALASLWQLHSTKWRIVAINSVSGLVACGTVGVLLLLGKPPIGVPSAEKGGVYVVAFVLATVFGLPGLLYGFLSGFLWAANTALEQKMESGRRAEFKRDVNGVFWSICVASFLFAMLFFSGCFGQPPQLRPISLSVGLLLGYTLVANYRGAGIVLAIITISLFFDAFTTSQSGRLEFNGWDTFWHSIKPELGWFILGCGTSAFATTLFLSKFGLNPKLFKPRLSIERATWSAMEVQVRLNNNDITFPQACPCCLGPIDTKRVQLIDGAGPIRKIMNVAELKAALKEGPLPTDLAPVILVPCCPVCRSHAATVARMFGQRVMAVNYLFLSLVLVGIGGYMTSRWLLTAIVVLFVATMFWFFRHGPGLRARGRRMMKSACCSLGPPVTFHDMTITFLNPEYADRFLAANLTTAHLVQDRSSGSKKI